MERIKSFEVNHKTLEKGLYISREDLGIITYDLRMKKPNSEDFLENKAIHTIEHLFATYVRNSSFKDKIIYFGPMGCRTGFYFLVSGISEKDVIFLVRDTMKFIMNYEGEIPGTTEIECGNYKEHDLEGAVLAAKDYYNVLKDYEVSDLIYKK